LRCNRSTTCMLKSGKKFQRRSAGLAGSAHIFC